MGRIALAARAGRHGESTAASLPFPATPRHLRAAGWLQVSRAACKLHAALLRDAADAALMAFAGRRRMSIFD